MTGPASAPRSHQANAASMLWDTPLSGGAGPSGWGAPLSNVAGLWADMDPGAAAAPDQQITPPPSGAVRSFDPFNMLGSMVV